MSLPSRERGLKLCCQSLIRKRKLVAPLAGAWIEIGVWGVSRSWVQIVAPLAGAWIEMHKLRGKNSDLLVAPLAGAWIEILCSHPYGARG